MPDNSEDFYDVESMTDEELETLIREELDEQPELDASGLDLSVHDGRVTVAGRVGTESEYQIIEHVMTDVIGVQVNNELVIDELVRLTQPEGADEANARLYATGSAHGGADRTEDTAEHLMDNTKAEQFGTDDMSEAGQSGYTYNPPTSPTQDGSWSKENH
jgi:hypothetical protein